ncbi:MAG TPA: hypothetical protein DHV85_20580 [Candidatus Accumulibacter sp.]|nr:hypothetical protein [Accumulibacter sp.]
MIDSKKISLIHLAKKNLAMTDDDYRALLLRAAGVESSTCLDAVGFAAVMVEFGRLGFESTSASERRKEPYRQGSHATYAQRSLIRRLWQAYKGEEDDAGLRHWLQRQFKVSHPRFLDQETTRKVICALRNFKPKAQARTTS